MKMTEPRLNINALAANDLLDHLIQLAHPILQRMKEIRVSAAGKMLALRKAKQARQ